MFDSIYKQYCFIYILCFFIGIYCTCYILSINYITFPIDHWCSPPFDFASQHWSPKYWKKFAIPYWDQIPDSFKTDVKPNRQSKCLQFSLVENITDTARTIEIKYSVDDIIPCQFGWYFSNDRISIVSQLELVCNKSWILTLCPVIFGLGLILSLVIIKFEQYMLILYTTITMMLSTSLSICLVDHLVVFIVLRFITALCFGANLLLSILLIGKMNIKINYDKLLLTGIVGWILAKGVIAEIIWLLKDWKITHILMSFSIIPVILFGAILFHMHFSQAINNVKYIEDNEHTNDLLEAKPISISNKLQYGIALLASLMYFIDNNLLNRRIDILRKSTYNSFTITSILHLLSLIIIIIAKTKQSVFAILLVSLIITCVTNICYSYKGLSGSNFNGIILLILDAINKIGVSTSFYTNLIILIDNMKTKTTRFNLGLLIVITASYGISGFISELVFLNDTLPNICLSITTIIAIIWLVKQRSSKTVDKQIVIFMSNQINEDNLCIIHDDSFYSL